MCASSSYRHHSPGSPREQGAHEIPYGPHGKHLLLWQVDVVLQPKGLNPVGVPDQAEVREACILELIQHLDDHSFVQEPTNSVAVHSTVFHDNLDVLHEGSFNKDNVGIVQFSTSLSGKTM